MKLHTARRRRTAFTLLELMIVMLVLAILASIAIPGTKHLIDRARRAAAENDALNLKNAIASYYTEYRRYPIRQVGPEDAASPLLSDHALMDILLASERETGPGGLSPRRHVTFTARNAVPLGGGRYRSGVVLDDDGGGTLWDPWGNHYRVLMDLNGDARVPAPGFVTGASHFAQSVIVWSPGKDGLDAESDDNIDTW